MTQDEKLDEILATQLNTLKCLDKLLISMNSSFAALAIILKELIRTGGKENG